MSIELMPSNCIDVSLMEEGILYVTGYQSAFKHNGVVYCRLFEYVDYRVTHRMEWHFEYTQPLTDLFKALYL